jgi:hypothetical protein
LEPVCAFTKSLVLWSDGCLVHGRRDGVGIE